jgi:hypothetical protein
MWYATRSAVGTKADEDAAMAYKKSGPFEKKPDAKAALLAMIENQIAGWERMKLDATNDENALAALQDETVDSVTVDGVRYQIYEV